LDSIGKESVEMRTPWEEDASLLEIERDLCGSGGITESEIGTLPGSDSSLPVAPPAVFFVVVFDARDKNKTASYGEVKILSMSVDGATLAVAGVLEIGQELLLINPAIGKQIVCRVCSVDPKEDGKSHVGVTFATAQQRSALQYWSAHARLMTALVVVIAASIWFAATLHRFTAPSLPASDARRIRGNTDSLDGPGYTGNSGVSMAPGGGNAYPLGMDYAASAAGGARPFAWPPEALRVIPGIAEFRVATAQDFDPQALSWLSRWRLQAGGVIPGNYVGVGSGESQAYILLGKDKSWRVLIVGGEQLRCDVRYPTIAIAARLPNEFIQSVQWNGPAPPPSDRDGLLIVRSAEDPSSAVVLFLEGNEVVSGSYPADYRQVPLTPIP
jgi:hypothetical protein